MAINILSILHHFEFSLWVAVENAKWNYIWGWTDDKLAYMFFYSFSCLLHKTVHARGFDAQDQSWKFSKDKRKGMNYIVILVAWELWKHINSCVFNGLKPTVSNGDASHLHAMWSAHLHAMGCCRLMTYSENSDVHVWALHENS
ncbi:hypothetical protein ACJX0J_006998 [Zea mays]